jgi:hypothetical protein
MRHDDKRVDFLRKHSETLHRLEVNEGGLSVSQAVSIPKATLKRFSP